MGLCKYLFLPQTYNQSADEAILCNSYAMFFSIPQWICTVCDWPIVGQWLSNFTMCFYCYIVGPREIRGHHRLSVVVCRCSGQYLGLDIVLRMMWPFHCVQADKHSRSTVQEERLEQEQEKQEQEQKEQKEQEEEAGSRQLNLWLCSRYHHTTPLATCFVYTSV